MPVGSNRDDVSHLCFDLSSKHLQVSQRILQDLGTPHLIYNNKNKLALHTRSALADVHTQHISTISTEQQQLSPYGKQNEGRRMIVADIKNDPAYCLSDHPLLS